jgi:hypothetical protein
MSLLASVTAGTAAAEYALDYLQKLEFFSVLVDSDAQGLVELRSDVAIVHSWKPPAMKRLYDTVCGIYQGYLPFVAPAP